jgi:hypothetical protein
MLDPLRWLEGYPGVTEARLAALRASSLGAAMAQVRAVAAHLQVRRAPMRRPLVKHAALSPPPLTRW